MLAGKISDVAMGISMLYTLGSICPKQPLTLGSYEIIKGTMLHYKKERNLSALFL